MPKPNRQKIDYLQLHRDAANVLYVHAFGMPRSTAEIHDMIEKRTGNSVGMTKLRRALQTPAIYVAPNGDTYSVTALPEKSTGRRKVWGLRTPKPQDAAAHKSVYAKPAPKVEPPVLLDRDGEAAHNQGTEKLISDFTDVLAEREQYRAALIRIREEIDNILAR